MLITIRKIGNSQGIIIPKILIEKYNMSEVTIMETEEGILLIPEKKKDFHQKLADIIETKDKWQEEFKKAASENSVQDYYRSEAKLIGDVDLDILE